MIKTFKEIMKMEYELKYGDTESLTSSDNKEIDILLKSMRSYIINDIINEKPILGHILLISSITQIINRMKKEYPYMVIEDKSEKHRDEIMNFKRIINMKDESDFREDVADIIMETVTGSLKNIKIGSLSSIRFVPNIYGNQIYYNLLISYK